MKYHEFQEKYPMLKAKAQEIYTSYKDQYENLLNYTARSTARKEYARGGLGFGLGYYWANPVADRVVGGVHRGHLLKRINTKKKPDWEYLLDKDDILIAAFETFSNHQVTHFLLNGIDEYTWEISFDDDGSLKRMCITYYSNNQIEFELTFDPYSFSSMDELLPHIRYDVWLFEHLQDGYIESEHINYPLYPEKRKSIFPSSIGPYI